MRKIKRSCGILIGLLLAVSLFAAAGCESLQAQAEEMSYERVKEPSFFLKGDSVYIVSGKRVMKLPDAGIINDGDDPYIAGMLSEDNKYLYYLTGIDEEYDDFYGVDIYYGGSLYMVETQTPGKPLKIADNVYSALLSADGKTLLYVTDVEASAGKLYSRDTGEKSILVADSVYNDRNGTDYYGASYDGKQIYYVASEKQDSKNIYTLYTKNGEQDAAALGETSSYNLGCLNVYVAFDDSGTILYSIGMNDSSYETDIYIKKSGEEAIVIDKGRIDKAVNGAEEFFYIKKGRRYYKAPGCDPIDVGKSTDKLRIQPYYGINPGYVRESRFLLETIGNPNTLTELLSDGTKNVIAEGYFDYYKINVGFTCVAYEQDGALYTVQKKEERWGKPEKMCDAVKRCFFNDVGDTFYYIALNTADDDHGDAYRLSLRSGRAGILQREVYSLWLCEDIPYTLTEDYGAYRIDNSPVRLDDPKIGPGGWLSETEGGYIVMIYRLSGDKYKEDIYFTEDGRDHSLLLEDVGDIVDVWDTSALFS